MIFKHKAIRNKYPNAVNIIGDKAYDKDNNLLTLDEAVVKTEEDKLQTEYDALEYSRKRKAEYPPMEDYLDGIVKDDQTQIDKYIADCKAIKEKYPK